MNFDFLAPVMNGLQQPQPAIPQIPPAFAPGMVASQPTLPSAGIPPQPTLGWMQKMNANPDAWLALGSALMSGPQVSMGPMGSLVVTDPGLGGRVGAGMSGARNVIQQNEDRAIAQRNAELDQQMRQEQISQARTTNQNLGTLLKQKEEAGAQSIAQGKLDLELAQRTIDKRAQMVDATYQKAVNENKVTDLELRRVRAAVSGMEKALEKNPNLYADLELMKAKLADLEIKKTNAAINRENATAAAQYGNLTLDKKRGELLDAQTQEQKLANEGLEAMTPKDRTKMRRGSISATEQAIENRMAVWELTRPEPTDPQEKTKWLREKANTTAKIRQEEYQREQNKNVAKSRTTLTPAQELAEANNILMSPDQDPEMLQWAIETKEKYTTGAQPKAAKTGSAPATNAAPANAIPRFVRDPKTGKIVKQ